jgi:hypothetical protein
MTQTRKHLAKALMIFGGTVLALLYVLVGVSAVLEAWLVSPWAGMLGVVFIASPVALVAGVILHERG